MLEKIEFFLRELIASFQMAKLYSINHPEFKKSLERAYKSLKEVFINNDEFIIGIVGEELAFEKEIFFDLSRNLKLIISDLKHHGVEKIIFYKGINKDELAKFINFLITPKEEIRGDPQEYITRLGVRNISIGKIKPAVSLEEELKKSISYLNLYKESLDTISGSVEKLLKNEPVDYFSLRSNITGLMESLVSSYQEFLKLATIKRYDITTFVHLLNVSILSMYFSSKIGFDKQDVVDIGIAGLFHDIGKLYISRRIIQKEGKLSDKEFEKIKNHSALGSQILLENVNNMGALPIVVCFEHHIKYNLEGYPKPAYPIKPHIASLIVSICDVYDAISQRRSYKRDYPPNEIYAIMLKEKGRLFDPRLLDRFFQLIGVWPPGTIVSLTDKRIAVVRQENEDDIYSPKVEAVFPEQNKELVDLRLTKDKFKIEYALNPFSKGKEYLHLV